MRKMLLCGIALLLFYLPLAGCGPPVANDPMMQQKVALADAINAYNKVVGVLLEYRMAGKINDAEAHEIAQVMRICIAALETWKKCIELELPADQAIEQFNLAIQALLRQRVIIERKNI